MKTSEILVLVLAFLAGWLFFPLVRNWRLRSKPRQTLRDLKYASRQRYLKDWFSIMAVALCLTLAARAQITYPPVNQNLFAEKIPLRFDERAAHPSWLQNMALALGGQVVAPTNTSSNPLDNIPQSASISNSTIDIAIGVVGALGGSANAVENIIEGRYHFGNFFVGGEIQNGPASSVIDKAGLQLGLSKRWDTAEIYGLAKVDRNFSSADTSGASKPSWEVGAGGGFSYRPITSGTLQSMALFTETCAIYRVSGGKNALLQATAGVRYFF